MMTGRSRGLVLGVSGAAGLIVVAVVLRFTEWSGRVASSRELGKRLFGLHCLRCHSGAMRAEHVAPSLEGVTRRMSQGQIVEAIRNGDPRGQMPAFRNLSDEEIGDILSYLTTLGEDRPTEPTVTNVAASLSEDQVKNLDKGLTCPCGCGMILETCECATATKVGEFIAEKFREGRSVAEVKSSVIEEYGQQVLSVSEIPGPLSSEEFRKIPRSYEIAGEIPQVLSQLPCFCACTGLGHRNVLDCFKSAHASRCDICMQEAILASDLHEQGKSVEEIRREITRLFFRAARRGAGGRKAEFLLQKVSAFLASIFR